MKPHIPILILSLAALSCSKKSSENTEPTTDTGNHENTHEAAKQETPSDTRPLLPQLPEEKNVEPQMPTEFTKAEDYIAKIAETIAKAQEQQNTELLSTLLGSKALNSEQAQLLKQLVNQRQLTVDLANPLQQIGELKANKHARWAINIQGKSPIILDVKRDTSGHWKVDKITLPDDSSDGSKDALPNAKTDALNFTHIFLKNLLQQDFKKAKSMVDNTNVTDAKLAGLCILFEEAEYQINSHKPLRSLFIRDTAAGFYVNVISQDGAKAAQFSVIAQRENAGDPWQIYEINLDQLLTDYAKRVSGGDTYFTPLLKNPKGGDSLVIYFEFDSEGLSPRTLKQLDIVTSILRLDSKHTITVSGHTDALGSNNYNVTLSDQRAQAVRDYFVSKGVPAQQVQLEAHGAAIPRQPNTLQDGTDNPTGRRANRRTEIYLNF